MAVDYKGPWTAPSAGIYANDGLLVCSLVSSEVVKAFRKRGDLAGSMMGDFAYLIAQAPTMFDVLTRMTEKVDRAIGMKLSGGDLKVEDWTELLRLSSEAKAALEATSRPPSPSERGVKFIVPLFGMGGQ